MKDENGNMGLNIEQLDEVAGGAGSKEPQDFGKTTVKCPICGTDNERPMLIRPGWTLNCSNCGAELTL